ncbi:MAG: hypothetical protein KDD65_16195 [Bacteroidetes bacterium]|nr:hypothetical protein [Bacteroidota bacterium]
MRSKSLDNRLGGRGSAFVVLGLTFMVLGITGSSAFLAVGIVFLAVGANELRRRDGKHDHPRNSSGLRL